MKLYPMVVLSWGMFKIFDRHRHTCKKNRMLSCLSLF
jgi:hypothetical protein